MAVVRVQSGKARSGRSRVSAQGQAADPPQAVLGAMSRLRKLHHRGQTLGEAFPRYGRSADAQEQSPAWFASAGFRNEDSARKVRQFADAEHGGFSKTELEELIALCEKHRRALGFTFVTKLMTVPVEKNRRIRFAERMIRERWSLIRVNQELLSSFGRRRAGGKKRRLPDDAAGLLTQLDRMALNWTKWCERAVENAAGQQSPLQSLPKNIRTRVTALAAEMQQLRRLFSDELDSARIK